ncbi:hypothetical protein D3C85_1162360 [compost metagenome]
MQEAPAEKYDSLKALLLNQLYRNLDLILILIHPLENERIFLGLDFLFKYLYHPVEECVGDPLNEYGDRLGSGSLQISRAVIGDIMVLFNHLHNHSFRLFINVRMIINGS